MATLYILRYNNYINRILKRGLSLSEYDLVNNCVYIKENINYVPGDDITTKQNITGADTNVYFGEVVYKPTIGDKTREIEVEDIARTNKILYATSLTSMLVFTLFYILIYMIIM